MQMYLNISFFLSAEHWIVIDGKKGQPHTHIWEISAKIASESFNGTDLGTGFTEVESVVRKYLSYYEGKTLNLLKPFDRFSPSTENLGLYFSQGIKGKLAEHGFVLMELAISESPTRGFVVTGLQEDAGFIGGALPDEFYQQHQGPVDTEPAGSAAVVVSGEDVLEDAAQEAAATDEEKMEDEEEDTQQGDNLESAAVEEGKTVWRVFWALLVIFCVNLLIYYPVLFTKAQLPWGSDSMGHVFKAEYLYQAIMQGDWFPRYLADWYNGIDPFRYWAPLPYYVLALVRFFTGDMVRAVNLFLFIVSFVGSGSWLLFRNRLTLVHSVALALIWVVVPENLRVGFSEGNVPRMLALMFLPLLIYLVLAIQNSEKRGIKIVALAATVSLIILSHAMMGALFLITLTLYLFLIMLFGGTSFKDFIRTVGVFVVGILLTCWWLVPSLVGGITGVNAEAATDTMRYFSPVVRLNPWERLHNYDAFYFGISYFVLALAALFQWSRKKVYQKAALVLGLLVFAASTTYFRPIYNQLPFHHLLWPDRATSAGIALLLLGIVEVPDISSLIDRRQLKRALIPILVVMLLFADGYMSTRLITARESIPSSLDRALTAAVDANAGFKVAMLDLSGEGSMPSYLISEKHQRGQIFGWAWQGAETGQNIVLLNTALQHGWYDYLFDRLIEMGATSLIVKEELLTDRDLFRAKAADFGFRFVEEFDGLSGYVKDGTPYLVSADYQILGIGRFAPNLAMIFPQIKLGAFAEVDKYSLAELKQYKTLLLSGFDWLSKKAAEELILDYANSGGRVLVDLTGAPKDVFSKRTSFLGVVAEPVIMREQPLISVSDRAVRLRSLPPEHLPWKTFVLEGMDKVSSLVTYYNQQRPIEGYKMYQDTNIYFMGLNLPYYAFLTEDPEVLNMLGSILHAEPGRTVVRDIVPLDIFEPNSGGVHLSFNLPAELSNDWMVIPMAYLDSMEIKSNSPADVEVGRLHNLIEFKGKAGDYRMEIINHWPQATKAGGLMSLLGVMLLAMLLSGRRIPFLVKAVKRTTGLTVLLLLMVLVLVPQSALAADAINLDGEFDDWLNMPHVDDPEGDVRNVSQMSYTAGDTRRVYWGTNDGESKLYFSFKRYPSTVKQDQNLKMSGKIIFDINNNGSYMDDADKVGYFQYNPNSGKVRVRLYRNEPLSDAPLWKDIGNWGEKGKGLQFEFYFPFDELGIIANQPIRFYAMTSFIKNDVPKQNDEWVLDPNFDDFYLYKHDFDIIPNRGAGGEIRDIQITPVPALGYFLLLVFVVVAVAGGIITIQKKKPVSWKN